MKSLPPWKGLTVIYNIEDYGATYLDIILTKVQFQYT